MRLTTIKTNLSSAANYLLNKATNKFNRATNNRFTRSKTLPYLSNPGAIEVVPAKSTITTAPPSRSTSPEGISIEFTTVESLKNEINKAIQTNNQSELINALNTLKDKSPGFKDQVLDKKTYGNLAMFIYKSKDSKQLAAIVVSLANYTPLNLSKYGLYPIIKLISGEEGGYAGLDLDQPKNICLRYLKKLNYTKSPINVTDSDPYTLPQYDFSL